MAEEKKIVDEMLPDEQLDSVAGGDELVLDGVDGSFYARSNSGDVEKDQAVKIENQNRLLIIF